MPAKRLPIPEITYTVLEALDNAFVNGYADSLAEMTVEEIADEINEQAGIGEELGYTRSVVLAAIRQWRVANELALEDDEER